MKKLNYYPLNNFKILYFVITALLICFTCFSYMPFFVDHNGNLITYILWASYIFISLIIFFSLGGKITRKLSYIVILFLCFVIFSFISFIFVSNSIFESRVFKCFCISFALLISGFLASNILDKRKYKQLFKIFAYSVLLMGITLFFTDLIKTDLTGKEYSYQSGKNEISVLFFASSVIFLFQETRSSFKFFVNFLVFLFLAFLVFLLRCRSVLVAYAIPVCICIFSKKRRINKYRFSFLLLIGAAILAIALVPKIRDVLFKSLISFGRDTADLSSIATGRFGEISKGLDALSFNPLFGVGRFKVEMFFLSIVVQYGFILSVPLFLFSIIPIFNLFIKTRFLKTDILAFLIIGISFVFLGFFEELMPLGPGVRTFFFWFFEGFLMMDDDCSFAYRDNNDFDLTKQGDLLCLEI